MKIAVDLDGVCYEWSRTARYMLREYRGQSQLVGEARSWDWNLDEGVPKEDWDWLWSEGVKLGLFRYGHMVKGARIGLNRIVTAGHSIEIATHRPVNAVNDTLDWLSLYFKDIPISGLHILSNGEEKTQVPCDILIDDKIENVKAWEASGRLAFLFDQGWNQAQGQTPRIARIHGWGHAAAVLESYSVEVHSAANRRG